MPDVWFSADPWFAGFVDGEGSFYIAQTRKVSRRPDVTRDEYRFAPGFCIGLRDDDTAILCLLREAFGGAIQWRNRTAHGAAMWYVTSKRDLARLVAYFDQFPLRAKKARDYVLWREAVAIYLKGTASSPGLPELKAALEGVREYSTQARETGRRYLEAVAS